MRQIRVTRMSRTRRLRRDALLGTLPTDPRDPDVVRAKQRQRDDKAADEDLPAERQGGRVS